MSQTSSLVHHSNMVATAATTTATNIIGASSSLSSSIGGTNNLSQSATMHNNNNGSNSVPLSSVLAPPNGTPNTNHPNYHLNSNNNSNGSVTGKSNSSVTSNNNGFTNNNTLMNTSNVYHHCLNPASNPRISSPPPQVASSGLSHPSPNSMNSPSVPLNNTSHVQNGGPAISCNNNTSNNGVITGSNYSLNHNNHQLLSTNNSLPSNYNSMGNPFGTNHPSSPPHHHLLMNNPNNASNNTMMVSGGGHSSPYHSAPNSQHHHPMLVNGSSSSSPSHPNVLSNQNLPNLGHSEQHSLSSASVSHHSILNHGASTFPFSGSGINPMMSTSSPLHTLHHQMPSSPAFPNTVGANQTPNQQQNTITSAPSSLVPSSSNSHQSSHYHQINNSNQQGSVATFSNNAMMALSPSNNSVTSVGMTPRGHHTSDSTQLDNISEHQKLVYGMNTSPLYSGGTGANSTATSSIYQHASNAHSSVSNLATQMQRDSPSTSTVDYSVDNEQSRPIMGHLSELSSPKDQPSNNDNTRKFAQESFPYVWKVEEFKRSVFYDYVHDYELKRARVYLLNHFPYYDPRLIEFNCKLFGVREDQSSKDRNCDLQKVLLEFDEVQFMLYLHVGRKRDALGIITSMINCGLICETSNNETSITNSLLQKYNALLFDNTSCISENFIPEKSITRLKELTEQFFNKYGVEEEHDYTPLSINMQSLEQKRKLEQESEDESEDDSDCSIYILSESEDDRTPRLRYYNNCYQNYIPEIYYQPTNNSSPISTVGVNEHACFEMGGMSKHGTLMTDSSFSPSIIGELTKKKKKKKPSSTISSSSSKDSDRTGSSSDSQEDDDYMPSLNGGISKKAKLKKKRRSNAKRACYHCRRSHLRCDNLRPCSRCTARGLDCYDMEQ